ncbi:hypothetical protein HYU93_03795 [Candidatus Daviesbacteria bacterium]|nr:hypothetical protein [Candidatus Daviesbacteria bacterium]
MSDRDEQNLNNYDLLTILGFKNIKDEDKARIDSHLGALVWEKFLTEKLEKELGNTGIKEVNEMVARGQTSEKIMNFIAGRIPKLKDILDSILIEAKKELMKDYYQKMLEEADRALFSTSVSDGERENIRERKNKYLKVKELFDNEEWQNLHELMSK